MVIGIWALIAANGAEAKCYSYKDLAYIHRRLGRGYPCPDLINLPGHCSFQALQCNTQIPCRIHLSVQREPTFHQPSLKQFRKLVAGWLGNRRRLRKTLIQIARVAQSCADPLAFIRRMIDLNSVQQICSRCVNEESHLDFCAWKQRSNLSSQVQRERISDLCI